MTKMLIPVVLVCLSLAVPVPAFTQSVFHFSTTFSLSVVPGDNGTAISRELYSDLLKELHAIDGVQVVDLDDVKHRVQIVVVSNGFGIAAASVVVTTALFPVQSRAQACAVGAYGSDTSGAMTKAMEAAVYFQQQYVFTSLTTDVAGMAKSMSMDFQKDLVQRDRTIGYTLWRAEHPESQ